MTTMSKFQEWIRKYGAAQLARKLKVDPSSVTCWSTGKNQPNLDHTIAILKLAKGSLKPQDLQKRSRKTVLD